jgi:hypothetical protein
MIENFQDHQVIQREYLSIKIKKGLGRIINTRMLNVISVARMVTLHQTARATQIIIITTLTGERGK